MRSPLKLSCSVPVPRLGIKVCKWHCVDEAALGSARFQSKRFPSWEMILHRSTKSSGMWQLSRFEDGAPVSDSQARSCNAALQDVGREYRLKEIVRRR